MSRGLIVVHHHHARHAVVFVALDLALDVCGFLRGRILRGNRRPDFAFEDAAHPFFKLFRWSAVRLAGSIAEDCL